ncbi:MAG: amidase family protein [Pseudomonadota bacterium]
MSDQWLWMSAAQLGRGIENGDIDPLELTDRYLTNISDHPNQRDIYSVVTAERARSEAEAARQRARSGLRRSPLDGVPVSWKDLFDSAGVPTEAGSALLKGRVPTRDAEVLRNATTAGLVCLGKTHMSELAFSGLGVNPKTGTPPNVHDSDAAPGGSSSGAAASVAFGLAVAGIGSDTGGSVRIPSAWNDLVGFKPSHGALSLEGVVPLCPKFDTVGPLARSVEDCALLMAALGGTRPIDLNDTKISDMRFLLLENALDDALRDQPRQGFLQAVDRLRNAGATVEEARFPFLDTAFEHSGILFASEAYGVWQEQIEANPDAMYPEILARFRSGRSHSAPDYVAAWRALDEYRLAWAEATASYDAVLAPSSPILPPTVSRLLSDHAYYVEENLLALRYTRIGNLMDICAFTLPTGIPSTGIQLLGKAGGETALLRVGMAAEAALS